MSQIKQMSSRILNRCWRTTELWNLTMHTKNPVCAVGVWRSLDLADLSLYIAGQDCFDQYVGLGRTGRIDKKAPESGKSSGNSGFYYAGSAAPAHGI